MTQIDDDTTQIDDDKTEVISVDNEAYDADFEKVITKCKTMMIRTFPFMAFIVLTTKFKTYRGVDTMAATVVGSRPTVLINPEFTMDKLKTDEERTFVFFHEILHLFYDHLGRQVKRGYDPRLWNIAADYFINSLIISMNSKHAQFPSMGLYDEKYIGLCSDEIYQMILDDNDGDADKAVSKFGGVGGESGAFDEIGTADLTSDQKADLKAALSASLSSSSLAGNMRNSQLVKSLYDLISPAVNWKDELADVVMKARDEYYTYKRYNTRSPANIIFPSSDGDKVSMLFGIDVSGSMSNVDVAEGLTELKSIVESFYTWDVKFVTCEMGISVVGEYSSETGDDFSSFTTEFNRGGGTDMNPIIEYGEAMEVEPSIVVIITDGYLSEDLIPSHIPVIVVITRNGDPDFQSDHRFIHIKD